MSNFKEFIEEPNSSFIPSQDSGLTIAEIQQNLPKKVELASSSFLGEDKAKRFSREVSSVIKDESFLTELSDKIGEPLGEESEDEFVLRSTNALKQMLHKKFRL